MFSIGQRILGVEALELKAMYFDLIEYIDCVLNKLFTMLAFETEYKTRAMNNANDAGIIMFCSICIYSTGLNVYNNETFLILRHFIGDDGGILLLNQSFNFVYKEGNYCSLKIWSLLFKKKYIDIKAIYSHINNTMYDLLTKYIGVRNMYSDLPAESLFISNGTMTTVGPSTCNI